MPTLHSYVMDRPAAARDRPALRIGARTWSFHELAAAASGTAAALAEAGWWNAGRTAGVLSGKTFPAYRDMLGVMHSGNVYVPLNPQYPIGRLQRLVDQAGLGVLLVDRSLAAQGAAILRGCRTPVRLLVLDDDAATHSSDDPGDQADAADLAGPADPADLAYLLFTSGSTGRPKGVPVSHVNAVACIEAVSSVLPVFPSDRVTQFAELMFDVSMAETFLTWRAGACVCVPSFVELMTAGDFVARHGITVWSSVPTLAAHLGSLNRLSPGCFPNLRLSLFCGEVLPPGLVRQWMRAAPDSAVVNLYGPTEAAIFATLHVIGEPGDDVVPIGHALPGMSWRIAEGELLLAGPQVVSGYWNDAAATRRSFVRLADDPQGRIWYRTGDRVRLSERDGLVFEGRRDRQVKIRGHRVEPAEVEAALRRITGAALVAAVPATSSDGRGEGIVAYCSAGVEPEGSMRDRCRELLPEYMIPDRIIVLPHFPVGGTGKVDYGELRRRGGS